MSDQAAIDTLVGALSAVPEYQNPLNPLYKVLGGERPLTLRTIHQHTQLLHEQVDLAQDQTIAISRVIVSCKQIPPTPFSAIPLRF